MVNNVLLLLLLVHWSSSVIGPHHLLHAVVVVPLHAQVAAVTPSSPVATHITVTVTVRASLGCGAGSTGIAGRGVRNLLWSQSVGREDVAQLVVLSWGRGRCPRLHKARVVGRLLEWLRGEERWGLVALLCLVTHTSHSRIRCTKQCRGSRVHWCTCSEGAA